MPIRDYSSYRNDWLAEKEAKKKIVPEVFGPPEPPPGYESPPAEISMPAIASPKPSILERIFPQSMAVSADTPDIPYDIQLPEPVQQAPIDLSRILGVGAYETVKAPLNLLTMGKWKDWQNELGNIQPPEASLFGGPPPDTGPVASAEEIGKEFAPRNTAEKVATFTGEQIGLLPFVGGAYGLAGKAVKAAGLAGKLSPKVAPWVERAATGATAGGAFGTAEGLAGGENLPEALKSGALSALAFGAFDVGGKAIGEGVKALKKPRTAKVAEKAVEESRDLVTEDIPIKPKLSMSGRTGETVLPPVKPVTPKVKAPAPITPPKVEAPEIKPVSVPKPEVAKAKEPWEISFDEYKKRIGSKKYRGLYEKWLAASRPANEFIGAKRPIDKEQWENEMNSLQNKAASVGDELKEAAEWLMTKADKRKYSPLTPEKAYDYLVHKQRKREIQEAISGGKNIPPEVLRDYPDLAGKAKVPEVKPTLETKPETKPAQVTLKTRESWETVLQNEAKVGVIRKDLQKFGVTSSGGGDMYLTGESDVSAIANKYPDVTVTVKDVNGHRATFNVKDFANLSERGEFTDRIRQVNLHLKPYKTNIPEGFMPEIFQRQQAKLESGLAKPIEPIEGIELTNNSTISLQQQQKFVDVLMDSRVRDALSKRGIKRLSIEPPYKFELSEQANINLKEKTISVNADADNPAGSILHEIGHDVYDSLPAKKKIEWRGRLSKISNEAVDGYKALNKPEEAFAETYAHMGETWADKALAGFEKETIKSEAKPVPQGVEGKPDRNTYVIERIDQEPFVVKRGDKVKVLMDNDKWMEGRVTGISHAKKQIRVNTVWYDYGYIYPAEVKAEVTKEVKGAAPLSKVIEQVNKKNEPPGGWGEAKPVTGKAEVPEEKPASLDQVRQEMGGKIDESIGEVNPPMGLSLRFVGKKPRMEKPGTESYTFEDAEIESRFKAAEGVKEESLFDKVRAFWDSLKRKATREYEYLPRTAEFSRLRTDLLALAKQKGVQGDETLRLLQGITINLDKNQYDVFRRHVILADLAEELKAGHDLPFGFKEESLNKEWGRIQEAAGKDGEVQRALADRKRVWQAINDDYIKSMESVGFHVEDKLKKEDYYRHQVLEYAKTKSLYGTGQKLKTPTGRGFLRKRGGSELDINTDYLQAEYEVMAQMLYDIEVAKTIKAVDDNYNVIDKLKVNAIQQNDASIMPFFQKIADEWNIARGPQSEKEYTAKDVYRQILNSKQAIGFEKLGKLASEGALPDNNGKYSELITELAENYLTNKEIKAAAKKDNIPPALESLTEESMNELFRYAAWLLKTQGGETGSGAAATIFKGIREKKEYIKNTLGDKFVTWKDLIPDGYTTWQPREGNVFYLADTIPGRLAEQLYNKAVQELGITEEQIGKVLAKGGKFKEFVVKEEVAATLDNLTKPAQDDILNKAISEPLRAWKIWQLVSPRRWTKYNFRNLSGDAEAVFVGNPSGFKKTIQAAKELYPVFAADKPMPQDMREWFERGGMQTLLQAQELGDINKLNMFVKLAEKKGKVTELPAKAWQGYWKAARLSTDFREAVLRYANFLDYLEQMRISPKGKPKNFGASIPEEVMALDDIYDRAFKLSNELLGAYDEVSVIGQNLRKYLIPFWSWNEVNFRRTKQLFLNAARDEGLAGMVGRKLLTTAAVKSPLIAYKVGKFALKAAALWVILQAWNETRFPQEEKELPNNVKSRPHIIFGRDKDGKILYFDRLGFVQDFLAWFGLDETPLYVKDYLNGKRTLKDIAVDMAKAPVNKLVQGIGPTLKTPAELITGKQTFPDIFKGRPIRDRGEYLAKSLGLENEYRMLAGKPVQTFGTGKRAEGYWKTWRGALVYDADPGQGAYWDTVELKKKYMKKLGKLSEGYFQSPKGDALYNFKLAVRYKDKKAAEKYLTEYAMYGGTKRGIEQSLKSMHPLYGLKREEQINFIKSLNGEDREKLIRSVQFYEDVLLGKKAG